MHRTSGRPQGGNAFPPNIPRLLPQGQHMARGFDPRFPRELPRDVAVQGGVRGAWGADDRQEVPLMESAGDMYIDPLSYAGHAPPRVRGNIESIDVHSDLCTSAPFALLTRAIEALRGGRGM